MPTDIKTKNGEIALGWDDAGLVSGNACLVQDILACLTTEKGALFYAPNFGAGILRYLHSSGDEKDCTELKALILQALKDEARIAPNSESVDVFVKGGVLTLALSFISAADQEKMSLNLTLDEGLQVLEGSYAL